MRRTMALILVLVMCLSLCGCKSAEVKNVEAQINTLSGSSTYKQIHEVFALYDKLSVKDAEKVENTGVLAEYCQPEHGYFVLTDEMVKEIKEEFKETNLGMTGTEFSVMYYFATAKLIYDWSDYSNVKLKSHDYADPYTYTVYGTISVADQYGESSTRRLEVSYFAEYDEENDGYKISHDVYISPN